MAYINLFGNKIVVINILKCPVGILKVILKYELVVFGQISLFWKS